MIKKVKCQKSNFNLENNKCICQENLFIYQVTRSTYSIIIFSIIFLCEFKGYIYIYIYTKLWTELGKFVSELIILRS